MSSAFMCIHRGAGTHAGHSLGQQSRKSAEARPSPPPKDHEDPRSLESCSRGALWVGKARVPAGTRDLTVSNFLHAQMDCLSSSAPELGGFIFEGCSQHCHCRLTG